jgi:hypothetical protein
MLHGIEVELVAQASVAALEVGRELTAQLRLGDEGPSGRFMSHNRAVPVRAREIVGHDNLIPSYSED